VSVAPNCQRTRNTATDAGGRRPGARLRRQPRVKGPGWGAYLGGLALIVVASWFVPALAVGAGPSRAAEVARNLTVVAITVGTLLFLAWAVRSSPWFRRQTLLAKIAVLVFAWFGLNMALMMISTPTSFVVASLLGPIIGQARVPSPAASLPGAQQDAVQPTLPTSTAAAAQQVWSTATATLRPLEPSTPSPTPRSGAGSGPAIATMYISADGDGAYVRRTPKLEDRYKAWPDGTSLQVFEYVSADWALVKSPDDYVGYIPRQYLASSPPPRPTAVARRLTVSLSNARYVGQDYTAFLQACPPYGKEDPIARVVFDLKIANDSPANFDWDFSLGTERGGFSAVPVCCREWSPSEKPAAPIPPKGSGTITCVLPISMGWNYGDAVYFQWQSQRWSWKFYGANVIAQQ
jgi:hypothetical protein